MKVNGTIPVYDGKAILFSDEKMTKVIQIKGLIRYIFVLGRQFYFLDPGGKIKTSFLRHSAIEAGFPSYEQKKNQAIPI